jgi:ADP-ribose pyrophosphatase YjhB (NUDIX family)
MPIPEFVARLRAKVGPDELLWLPGVTAVVIQGDRVLLVRRSDNGQWTPITGIVDPGEHPEVAAVREVEEETLVRCRTDVLASVSVTPEMVYPNGDRAQYIDLCYRCSYLGGEPGVGDDESMAVGWFALDDLPPMAPDLRERIRAATAVS